MRIYRDPARLARVIDTYRLDRMFDSREIRFTLCAYERGELLNLDRSYGELLQFLISGSVRIYSLKEDGTEDPLCCLSAPTILGDLEFCGELQPPFLVEVVQPCLCVEIDVRAQRELLLNDAAFLRTLLSSVSHKLSLISQSEAAGNALEAKVLRYLRVEVPSGQLCGVDSTAKHLRCSRRQLQRVLKELTEKGILERCGKGEYRLSEINAQRDDTREG